MTALTWLLSRWHCLRRRRSFGRGRASARGARAARRAAARPERRAHRPARTPHGAPARGSFSPLHAVGDTELTSEQRRVTRHAMCAPPPHPSRRASSRPLPVRPPTRRRLAASAAARKSMVASGARVAARPRSPGSTSTARWHGQTLRRTSPSRRPPLTVRQPSLPMATPRPISEGDLEVLAHRSPASAASDRAQLLRRQRRRPPSARTNRTTAATEAATAAALVPVLCVWKQRPSWSFSRAVIFVSVRSAPRICSDALCAEPAWIRVSRFSRS